MRRINQKLLTPIHQLQNNIEIRNVRSTIRPTYWRELGYKVRLIRGSWNIAVINCISLPDSPIDIYFPNRKSFHSVMIHMCCRLATGHVFIRIECRKQTINQLGVLCHNTVREYIMEIWRPW